MSVCLECNKAKDNGEPYCADCDPTGEYARALATMSSDDKAKMARKAKQAELKAQLAELEKESN